ncbi:hypothetical protein PRIPAC_91762 [Pristionchus pacificus]|nr:hypothetical protein PRIPAC_91762 [Pristionchus pacificus]
MHGEVDGKLFPGAHISMSSLVDLPASSLTACLTIDAIRVFRSGEPVSPDEFTNDTLIIWNERASEFGEDIVEVMPSPPPKSKEDEHHNCILMCLDIHRRCEEIIEAYRLTESITKKNLDRTTARIGELTLWLNSIERAEKQSISIVNVSSIVTLCGKEIFEQTDASPNESSNIWREVKLCAEKIAKTTEYSSKFSPLDERCVDNWQSSLQRLSTNTALEETSNSSLEMYTKWAKTLKQLAGKRLSALMKDCKERMTEKHGIGYVIRNLIAVDQKLTACLEAMKETANCVTTVADQALEQLTAHAEQFAEETRIER